MSDTVDFEFKREISGPCRRAAKISLREWKQKSFRLREEEFAYAAADREGQMFFILDQPAAIRSAFDPTGFCKNARISGHGVEGGTVQILP